MSTMSSTRSNARGSTTSSTTSSTVVGPVSRDDDPVEVRRGEAQDPEQFLWQGRLWKVRAVLARWVETGSWRQVWRVEAGRGTGRLEPVDRGGDGGPVLAPHRDVSVFDLSFDDVDGRWQLSGRRDGEEGRR